MVLPLGSYADDILSDNPIGTGCRADYFVQLVNRFRGNKSMSRSVDQDLPKDARKCIAES